MKSSLEGMAAKINMHRVKYKRSGCGITSKEIKKMVKYSTDDLKTGKILQHNLQAGMDADAALGI
jgi:hypothetical protein